MAGQPQTVTEESNLIANVWQTSVQAVGGGRREGEWRGTDISSLGKQCFDWKL